MLLFLEAVLAEEWFEGCGSFLGPQSPRGALLEAVGEEESWEQRPGKKSDGGWVWTCSRCQAHGEHSPRTQPGVLGRGCSDGDTPFYEDSSHS